MANSISKLQTFFYTTMSDVGIIDTNWKYKYSQIDTSPAYPLVCLRSGYKTIREDKDGILIGWKYELLNVDSKGYKVTVNYSIKDYDGFILKTDDASEYLKPNSNNTIRGTMYIDIKDKNRINSETWTINTSPTFEKKGNFDRFLRAGKLLKELDTLDIWWVDSYLNYKFDDIQSFEKANKENNKWYIIAKATDFQPNDNVKDIRKKLSITGYELPKWDDIRILDEYKKLSEDEKDTLKSWLRLQETFSSYDPKIGRSWGFILDTDYQD